MSVAEIRLQEGESIENALRLFKRKVQTEDIIKEVKRHSYLSEARREAPGKASFGATAFLLDLGRSLPLAVMTLLKTSKPGSAAPVAARLHW